ncbi:MAG: Mut7-C ubiquitin/RNAse domain-containing protein [Acidobacteria bacterium]|nr:Mut7-C ubiquitin/RNAse domain-containing protein [Acidobacteriota bacterium]
MTHVWFRFYGELNDFVRPDRRARRFVHVLRGPASVKDTIEAQGVPHPEVDLIVVNGQAVDFGYLLRDGDRVAVYPPFRSLDLGDVGRVGEPPPEPLRFVLDVHLQKLASLLRLAGFDAEVREDDADIARAGGRDRRVVLTRDLELLKRNEVRWGYWVRTTDPARQFLELVRRYDLAPAARPFTRCLCCNDPLRPAAKEDVIDRLPPRARAEFDEFHTCDSCGRVYWRGSHYQRLRRFLDQALRREGPPLRSSGARRSTSSG